MQIVTDNGQTRTITLPAGSMAVVFEIGSFGQLIEADGPVPGYGGKEYIPTPRRMAKLSAKSVSFPGFPESQRFGNLSVTIKANNFSATPKAAATSSLDQKLARAEKQLAQARKAKAEWDQLAAETKAAKTEPVAQLAPSPSQQQAPRGR